MANNGLTPANPPTILLPDEALEFMNTHYAIVMGGGKIRVLSEEYDEGFNRWLVKRIATRDLAILHANSPSRKPRSADEMEGK